MTRFGGGFGWIHEFGKELINERNSSCEESEEGRYDVSAAISKSWVTYHLPASRPTD